MNPIENIETRFGSDAAKAVAGQIGNPPAGNFDLQPAPKDRSRGAVIGAVVGEALGEPVEDRPPNWIAANLGPITGHVIPNPKAGSDTQLTLMTASWLVPKLIRNGSLHGLPPPPLTHVARLFCGPRAPSGVEVPGGPPQRHRQLELPEPPGVQHLASCGLAIPNGPHTKRPCPHQSPTDTR